MAKTKALLHIVHFTSTVAALMMKLKIMEKEIIIYVCVYMLYVCVHASKYTYGFQRRDTDEKGIYS